jgi:hypothetical protein
VDVPPQDQQAPSLPAVPAQRPADDVAVLPPAPNPPARRRRNWRLILVVILGTLSVLCSGGSVAGYVWYSQGTAPNRSTPDVAVRQYLQATFGDRDESQAGVFTCGRPSLAEVQTALTDIKDRESRFSIKIVVGWEGFSTNEQGKNATVKVHILIRVPEANGSTSESIDPWIFTTVDEDGWRVCGAHKVS